MMKRRTFLAGAGAGVAAAVTGFPAIAQAPTKLRIGYLHGLATDGPLWLAETLGAFKDQGLAIETVQFVTGLEAYQALVGGSLDLVTTGAVISNFPARGQGKAFLVNSIETATGQLWGHPDQGVKTVADLKGKKIATSRGTTAHVLLHRALQTAGIDSTRDIEIVHQQMGNAVTAFISGAVPAVATWIPFDAAIAKQAKGAVKIADAGDFPAASVVDGWSARNDFHDGRKDVLKRFIKAWRPANDLLATRPDEAIAILHKTKFADFTVEQLQQQYKAARWRTAADWTGLYRDGSVTKWLNNVTDFNVEVGAFKNPVRAESYFDPALFLETIASI